MSENFDWKQARLEMLEDMVEVLEGEDPSDLYLHANSWVVDAEMILPHYKESIEGKNV
jgi:hypothetical protein